MRHGTLPAISHNLDNVKRTIPWRAGSEYVYANQLNDEEKKAIQEFKDAESTRSEVLTLSEDNDFHHGFASQFFFRRQREKGEPIKKFYEERVLNSDYFNNRPNKSGKKYDGQKRWMIYYTIEE